MRAVNEYIGIDRGRICMRGKRRRTDKSRAGNRSGCLKPILIFVAICFAFVYFAGTSGSSNIADASAQAPAAAGNTAQTGSDPLPSDDVSLSPTRTAAEAASAAAETAAPSADLSAAETPADAAPADLAQEQSGENAFDLSSVPAYAGTPYIEINGNEPYFTAGDLTAVSYESYSPLDGLGRCGAAIASVGRDLMPSEPRGSIGMIKPSGWHTVKYDGIDGNYLYNRCHLIAYELTGENANERNLITGTRYLNTEGMLPLENRTADYVTATGNHVLYRVTPVFEANNLVAAGVLMEAESVEDGGKGISFCVFCYNVQPGITIDYATGDSSGPEFQGSVQQQTLEQQIADAKTNTAPAAYPKDVSDGTRYALNQNTKKFHYPDCSSVDQIKPKNYAETTKTRDELIAEGYQPCGRCHP